MKLNLSFYEDLIRQGLVKTKTVNGRVIIKYARKVFYNNLWLQHPLLVEARGHVFDELTGQLLVAPPTKVFNLHENGAGTDIPGNKSVVIVRKVNGFLACVTFIGDEMLVSTTGSLDSDFVTMARKHLEKLDWDRIGRPEGVTFHFEICDQSDPHITFEIEGAYLIGQRSHSDLSSALEFHLDDTAYQIKAMRPGHFAMAWTSVIERIKTAKHEGYMVRDWATGQTLVKLKSPHYLTKKFLMRMSSLKVVQMFTDKEGLLKTADEEFYSVIHKITRYHTLETWGAMDDQERRRYIEAYFEDRQS